jgi:CRISPR system Cascade subunit CasE
LNAPLSLVRLTPDLGALSAWAVPKGYMAGVSDPGYALHAALRTTFGDLAPRPFVLRGRSETPELLGYVRTEPAALLEAASLAGTFDPGAAGALRAGTLEARALPGTWTAGRCWGFEVRLRPVVRSRISGRNEGSAEIDVALWQAERAAGEGLPSRETRYVDWLAARLAASGAARLVQGRVVAMASCRVLRRPRAAQGRTTRAVPGPDVTIRGDLEVADGARLAELLAGGIGRHRAFGFGCLLLAPPGSL